MTHTGGSSFYMQIVNPPSWFGKIWKIMRAMLVPSFRRKVKVIKEAMLSEYLMSGYEEFLPNDFMSGKVDTKALAQDFVTYRQYVERSDPMFHAKAAADDESSHPSSVGSRSSLDTSSRSFDPPSSTFSFSSEEDENDDASIHCDIDCSYRS